jgi:predicted ATPase/DNA-binding CsgD family transcriptional regulator
MRCDLPPELTSFVGRDEELRVVLRLVSESRLVTLTGFGGSGKTRLAARAAAELRSRFRHGAVFVDLVPLADPSLIPQAIIQALGVPEVIGQSAEHGLHAALTGTEVLIVLDNCEHLVQGCAGTATGVLAAASQVRVLATSREPLDVDGEMTFPVPPLAIPPAREAYRVADLMECAAVRLFCERAAAARPGFAVTDANAAAVAGVCQRLDGLPLAIELAATRVRSMSAEEILERLEDRFSLLRRAPRPGSGRHQTLRAAVEWSHDLLTAPERVLFRRLSVFSGGWGLADAEAVCPDASISRGAVMELHTRLVDRSMVAADHEPTGRTRYRFLDTLQRYAAECLAEAGEVDILRARHYGHFRSRAEAYYRERYELGSDAGLSGLAANRDNFRAALGWAAETDKSEALRLAAILDDFWLMISAAEGWSWLQQILPAVAGDSLDRIQALITAGRLAAYVHAYAEGSALLKEAILAARQRRDRLAEAWAQVWLGRLAFFAGDPVRAEADLERALATHESLRSVLGVIRALCLLGLLQAVVLRRHEKGRQKLDRALALARQVDDRWGEGYAHMVLGRAAADDGDVPSAYEHCQAALDTSALGALLGIPLQTVGRLAVERQPGRAMRLLGAGAAHFARTDIVPPPFLQQRSDDAQERAEQILGAEAAARAWDEGQQMTRDEARTYARSDPQLESRRAGGGLTPRESQVASLVGRGLTNREIAAALHVSVRTAESHVDHILSRLGLRNRTELAAWADENIR